MKFIIMLLLSVSMLGAKAGKNDDQVSQAVVESFNNAFRNAESVSWTEGKEFYKAEFLLNCQYVNAFYSKTGALLATSRNLRFTELPVILQTSMKEVTNGYWVTDLFELSNDEGTTYYITIENADQKIVYQSAKTGWNLYQKKTK